MRVMVLGATGHVGQAVVRLALAQGHHVTAATRQADPPALRGLSVTIAPVDEGYSRLTELASGQDLVVDAAAPYPLDASVQGSAGWRMIIDAALRRTERVLDATRRNRAAARVRQLVYHAAARGNSPARHGGRMAAFRVPVFRGQGGHGASGAHGRGARLGGRGRKPGRLSGALGVSTDGVEFRAPGAGTPAPRGHGPDDQCHRRP